MKTVGFLTIIFLTFACPLFADATAYQALEYLVERKGKGALRQVFLVSGEQGASQPETWVVFRGRPNAVKVHAKEISSKGRITSCDVPASEMNLAPHSRPINFSVLNLDTNAAWNIAKKQARKENFRFNKANYRLTTHSLTGVPAWTMQLFNEKRGTMGELTISGATGDVLDALQLYRYRIEVENGQETLFTKREPWGYRALRSIGRWFSQTGEAYGHDLQQAAGTTEEILVGRRTRDYSQDAR